MSNIVEVTDQCGGSISASKNALTGQIHVVMFNGATRDLDEFFLDPEDPTSLSWLKEVFQPIHLEILLG